MVDLVKGFCMSPLSLSLYSYTCLSAVNGACSWEEANCLKKRACQDRDRGESHQ